MKTLNKSKSILLLFFLLALSVNLFSQISTIIPSSGFGDEEDYVLSFWANSGSYVIRDGNLFVDEWIDITKSDYDIHPDMEPVGEKIMDLIGNLNHSITTLLYFPPGAYLIETPLIIPSNLIIKGAGGDGNTSGQTHFHFNYPLFGSGTCISFSGSVNSGFEDICIYDDMAPLTSYMDPETGHLVYITRYDDMIRFSRSSSHCWIRGVESVKTRRFHVNIYGHNITVSGCYFHHSWDYGTGGRGYGVCLSGSLDYDYGSYACRIENNIFHDLRHSMVFQYNPALHVLAYNYSRDARDSWGYNDNSADLLFHGNHGDNHWEHIGPYWNLVEGNINTYLRFDEYHKQNGPYNTIFRCKATHKTKIDLISGVTNQYKQNFVGSDSDPTNSTQNKIEEHGYSRYWEESPDWSNIPSDSCSYYQESKPDFWDMHFPYFIWPFSVSGLNPAKYRYKRNNGYYEDHPPTTEVVFAGWELYANMCGPPYWCFSGNTTLNDATEEYLAMNEIETDGTYILNSNNNIVFKADEKIVLKPGFKVTANNNYFFASIGATCATKSSIPTKNNVQEPAIVKLPDNYNYLNFDEDSQIIKKSGLTADVQSTEVNTSSIYLGPNPNNGLFSLFLPQSIMLPLTVHILDINGILVLNKEITTMEDVQFDIRSNPKGVYLLKLITEKNVHNKKIVYSL